MAYKTYCNVCGRAMVGRCSQKHSSDDARWSKNMAKRQAAVDLFKEGRLPGKLSGAVTKSKLTGKPTLSPRGLDELIRRKGL